MSRNNLIFFPVIGRKVGKHVIVCSAALITPQAVLGSAREMQEMTNTNSGALNYSPAHYPPSGMLLISLYLLFSSILLLKEKMYRL